MVRWKMLLSVVLGSSLAMVPVIGNPQGEPTKDIISLPSSKLLPLNVSGKPQRTNSFPVTIALNPDGRYAALLNNGYGTAESDYQESIAVLDLNSNQISDFPDSRLGKGAHQTYFLGLAFSADGKSLYASISSLTDPEGKRPGNTGNGIAVYRFEGGRVTPERFIPIPLQPLGPSHPAARVGNEVPAGKAVPYPAGLVVVPGSREKLLVADNLSDDALLFDAKTGDIIHRFDLSTHLIVPASYPYAVVATKDGARGYCSLWNASRVAELDLESGRVVRMIPLLSPNSSVAPGSHPTAMLLSPDEKRLYVTLSNADRVAVIDTATGEVSGLLVTGLPGQRYGGSFPNALAQNADGTRLFVADASANAVAVFDSTKLLDRRPSTAPSSTQSALGFISTEWYPTALAVTGGDLLIATGKGKGTGPNSKLFEGATLSEGSKPGHDYPYIAALIHGSIARLSYRQAEKDLRKLTQDVEVYNRMPSQAQQIKFRAGKNPIQHVIYIIKENRSYDQVFGDLKEGNGDPSLVMYGEDVTPNLHKLAKQFGILDNFYVSGEVSGDGHVWSTAAITTDYLEKTWEIAYRGSERTYDYLGEVANGIPLLEGQPDVDDPGTGYIWTNVARAGLSHRNYGEFVATLWCNDLEGMKPPKLGAVLKPGEVPCTRNFVRKGESLPSNVGDPHGSPSPWPWQIPMIAANVATKPELEGHFDPFYADWNLDYPDQLRVDEFLNEFEGYVKARKEGKDGLLPQFVLVYLPNDHTMGTRPGGPWPTAMVADNDLAVGRLVDAISHSPYWDDTAIFILEDDAQDGPDHVDAHRSPAFVISKYSPSSPQRPVVDSNFYTTVNMIRTMEVLLGLPPMNNNDAQAPVMAMLFSGPGNQPAFTVDTRNRDNGLLYQTNPPQAAGAKESLELDFSKPDSADTVKLNAILWRDSRGSLPIPAPHHAVVKQVDGD